MTQKTLVVEHPEAHYAPEGALEAKAAEEGVPEGWTVTSSVNESGHRTKYVLYWDDEAPADAPKVGKGAR